MMSQSQQLSSEVKYGSLSFGFLQADIAPLMASLIGVPIPVNSVVSAVSS